MKPILLILLCSLEALAGPAARACTLAPGYGPAPVRLEMGSAVGPAPAIRLVGFARGYDDGDSSNCSVFAELRFEIEGQLLRLSDAYRFRRLSGNLPDEALPSELVVPVELGDGARGFVFRWLDVPPGSTTLAPIAAIVSVQSVAETGAVSASTVFRVQHPGGPVPTIDTPTTTVLDLATAALVVLPVIVLAVAFIRRRRSRLRDLHFIRTLLGERSDS
jgi:hypothetical protein